MPLYDGNDKIQSIFINAPQYADLNDPNSEIIGYALLEVGEIRTGSTPVFPDSVGQLNITGFEILNTDGSEIAGSIPKEGATLMYRVTGQPGAEFLVDAVSVGISISSSIIEIPDNSTRTYEQTFTVLAQADGNGARQLLLRVLPIGATGLGEEVETPISVTQEAGTPLPTLNMSAGYSWYPGATAATVSPESGPSTAGTQFTVTIPSGMFSPPSGWVVAQVQWSDRNYLDETYDGIYATSEGIAAGETPLSDAFGVPQGLSATSYQSNTYTFNSDGTGSSYTSNGTVVYRHTSGEREGRAYTVRYTFTD